MNLIIDIGNTFAKVAVFSAGKLFRKKVVSHGEWLDCSLEYLEKYSKIDDAIISTVGGRFKNEIKTLSKEVPLTVLNYKTPLPFKIKYKTPKTLGVDRIALTAASCIKYTNKNVLVIDAGTCITYDFITNKNEYLGGAISPGIQTRYTSLNNLTANLPLLSRKYPENITGQSTKTSIHSGVVNGVIFEINGVVEQYLSKYGDLTVILTGGDAHFLSKKALAGVV